MAVIFLDSERRAVLTRISSRRQGEQANKAKEAEVDKEEVAGKEDQERGEEEGRRNST